MPLELFLFIFHIMTKLSFRSREAILSAIKGAAKFAMISQSVKNDSSLNINRSFGVVIIFGSGIPSAG